MTEGPSNPTTGVAPGGFVSIVGAGPGDPQLVTLAARDRLERADVVIADYLANPALLLHCRADAEVVQRRRGPRSDTPLPAGLVPLTQAGINALMLEHAEAGRHVVRLKGGDPCMFGRGAEEAQHLAAHGIAFELVPGVSSPIAAPESAGIPVTHRAHTPAVTFVSGFEAYDKAGLAVAWTHLARSAGTIVLMMSVGNLRDNARRLVEAGRDASTPAAMVRWGTRGIQRTVTATLADIADEVEAAGIRAPAVLVVGDVVSLRQTLQPLTAGRLEGCRVAVTRSVAQGQSLVAALARHGADAVPIPCLAIEPRPDPAALDQALRRLAADLDGVIISSPNGASALADGLLDAGLDLRALAGKKIAVVGKATARACRAHGLVADVVPDTPRAEGLLEALREAGTLGARWLWVRADEARAVLPTAIAQAGGSCDEVVGYRAVRPAVPALLLTSLLAAPEGEGLDAVCFASGKTARHFLETCREGLGEEATGRILAEAKVIALGPVTAAALAELGMTVAQVADAPTDAAMLDAVARALGRD